MKKPLAIRLAGLAAGVALLSQAVVPAAAAAPAAVACSGRSMEIMNVETLKLEVVTPNKTYRTGQKVVFDFTVTRPAEEDPVGLGVPMPPVQPEAAADVTVGVGIAIEDVFLWGLAVTNAEGKATLSVKLPKYVKPGTAFVRGMAQKVMLDTPCLTIIETGYDQLPAAFKVGK